MLVIDGKEVFTTLDELVDPRHSALLLVDLQNDFILPGGHADKTGLDLSACRRLVPRVKQLLVAARDAGVRVVHIQLTLFPGHLAESPAVLHSYLLRIGYGTAGNSGKILDRCIRGTWGWQIVDELAPLPGEIVVEKQHSSAFMDTNLDLLLRSNGVKSVCIVGLVTDGCVMATASDAPVFGYYPILIRDCIGSRSPDMHKAALLILSQRMVVVDAEPVLGIWARQAPLV